MEIARLKKESQISVGDLEQKCAVLNQKINEINLAKNSIDESLALNSIELEEAKMTITSLTNQISVLERANEMAQSEVSLFSEQISSLETNVDEKTRELEQAKTKIRDLQQNMVQLIERSSEVTEAATLPQIDRLDLDNETTVDSLECKICCERNKQKSCLPVSYTHRFRSFFICVFSVGTFCALTVPNKLSDNRATVRFVDKGPL